MKKILSFIVVQRLIFGAIGVAALNLNKTTNNSEKINNEFFEMDFTSINVIENKEEIIFSFTEDELFLLNPGQPMIPKVVKKFEWPFGVTNINVELIP